MQAAYRKSISKVRRHLSSAPMPELLWLSWLTRMQRTEVQILAESQCLFSPSFNPANKKSIFQHFLMEVLYISRLSKLCAHEPFPDFHSLQSSAACIYQLQYECAGTSVYLLRTCTLSIDTSHSHLLISTVNFTTLRTA